MTGYLFLVLAAVMFTVQFVFSKKYQLSASNGICASGCFMLFQYLWIIIIWEIVYKFNITLPSGSRIWYSVIYMTSALMCTACALAAMRTCKVAVVTLFEMVGGQVLPFVYGYIFTGAAENTSWLSWLGLAALIATCFTNMSGKDNGKSNKLAQILLCTGAFIGNGMISIATDMNAKAMERGDATSEGFMLLNAIIGVGLGLIVIIISRKQLRPVLSYDTCTGVNDKPKISYKKAGILVLLVGGYAVLNGLGNVFSLLCGSSKGMQPTVQYPVLNALIIIMMPLIGRVFFREKITKRILISSGLAIAGIMLIMLDALI